MKNIELWFESCSKDKDLSLYKLQERNGIALYSTKKTYMYKDRQYNDIAVCHIWDKVQDKCLLSTTNQKEAFELFERYADTNKN